MATSEAVISLLVMLAITSSVMSVYQLQSPADVSRLANIRSHVMSQSRTDDDGDEDVRTRRTPGWGKRRHDILPAMSQYATSKRRGWGKRDIDSKCDYWRSLLQFIEVSVGHHSTLVMAVLMSQHRCTTSSAMAERPRDDFKGVGHF